MVFKQLYINNLEKVINAKINEKYFTVLKDRKNVNIETR